MAKTVNYTTEQTAEMLAAYMLAPTKETVSALAAQFGKTTRSIIAKLSREGVYKKAEYVNKNGETPVDKEKLVSEIAALIGTTADKLGGLEKANKAALKMLRDALTPDAEPEAETGAESDSDA
jgi:hypothetical protein